MPDIASALKAEIARLARKQIKVETEALRKAVAGYRREIAALKRRVASVERQGKQGSRGRADVQQAIARQEGDARPLRFSSKRLAAQRAKLAISAADFALLVGVSPLTIYKWEKGEARPRAAQLQALAQTRGLGKREALTRLQVLKAVDKAAA